MSRETQLKLAAQRCAISIASFKGELERIGPGVGGRERSLAITHAETAMLWAREGLKE